MYCSPSHYKYSKKGTCFSMSELNTISNDINEKEKKQIIKGKTFIEKKKQIDHYFYDICKNKEYCWLDHLQPRTRSRLEDAFRPVKPRSWYSNSRAWLSTDDIQNVMSQYEKLHKDFKFMGVFSLDFAKRINNVCIGENMCDFDITSLKNKKRFAMVINLDYHNQPGSHWVALYCSLYPRKNNFGIYYYDSTSMPPYPEVIEFIKRIKEQVIRDFPPKTANKFEIAYNTIQRQFKNTECGMFCIVFLTQCIKNIKYLDICKYMKTDDGIHAIRDILYRPIK